MTWRRPCWCPQLILRELNSTFMQKISFVLMGKHAHWSRELKHSTDHDLSSSIYIFGSLKHSHKLTTCSHLEKSCHFSNIRCFWPTFCIAKLKCASRVLLCAFLECWSCGVKTKRHIATPTVSNYSLVNLSRRHKCAVTSSPGFFRKDKI